MQHGVQHAIVELYLPSLAAAGRQCYGLLVHNRIAIRVFRESGMFRKLILAVVSSYVIVPAAQAARLTEIQGTVLVNTGEGFQEAIGKTDVSAGDRVLIRGKGKAQIDYGAGCVVKLSDNQTAVVATKPNCNSTPVPTPKKVAMLKETKAAVTYTPVPRPLNDGQGEKRILIVGGLVVVGSAVAAIVTSNGSDDKDRPRSLNDSPVLASAEAPVKIEWIGGDTDDEGSSSPSKNRAQAASKDLAAATALTDGDRGDGTPVSP